MLYNSNESQKKNNKAFEFISRISYINKDEAIEYLDLSSIPPHLIKNKFYDQDFPPEYPSLENPKNRNPLIKKNDIQWKRADDIFDSNHNPIFIFKKYKVSEVSKIIQGMFVKNPYFLYAVSFLQLYNMRLIERLFITNEYNHYGCYGVIINYNGEWRILIVDDNFPFLKSKNQLLFSKSDKNELWLMLLEKVYAKMYGSYENTHNGNFLDALFDLTGINHEFFDKSKFKSQEEVVEKFSFYQKMSKYWSNNIK